RKFLDFFIQCTGSEYRESDLEALEQTLKEYYDYCPVFEKYSEGNMKFPKQHMLTKYVSDIREYGAVKGYSRNQSEHQHIASAKTPTKRTNNRWDLIVQVSFGKVIWLLLSNELFLYRWPDA
ncbi:hypothetical protein BJV82DRAFT_524296, partial [Fennellomyces sp. T-0311]